VPELPDLTVVAEALDAALRGRQIRLAEAPGPLAVRGTPAELAALIGQRVTSIRHRGKFLMLDLDRDHVVFNPMLTGRFQLAANPGIRQPGKTAVVLGFGARTEVAGARPPFARWTRGAAWLPEVDEIGPDIDDPALTVETWRERIRRHPGELKNLLRNQAFVAGIGNAYSDEILHAARLLPFRKRSTLAPEEVDTLYTAARSTVADAIAVLRRRVPPTFETQVRDFLAVHMKGGQACPRCGKRITEVKAGGFVTSYCRGCQR